MTASSIRIADITIGDRTRAIDANITPLAADVARNGIRDPIIVTNGGHLVDGWRRIQAATRAGHAEISGIVADGISGIADAVAYAGARHPMRFSDAMRYAEFLIELDQDAAAERRIARSACAGRGERQTGPSIRTREIVARIIGWSHSTLGRGLYLWRHATTHRDLIAALDDGITTVNHAYDQARAADLAAGRPEAQCGKRIDSSTQHRAVRAVVAQCDGIAQGIRGIGPMAVPPEDAVRLAARLIASRTAITQLINNLRKATNHA